MLAGIADLLADRPGHEVDFILEQDGKLVALEIKTGGTVMSSDAGGIRAFRASLKKNQLRVRGGGGHAGQGRSLDTDLLALPWGWVVAAAQCMRCRPATKTLSMNQRNHLQARHSLISLRTACE